MSNVTDLKRKYKSLFVDRSPIVYADSMTHTIYKLLINNIIVLIRKGYVNDTDMNVLIDDSNEKMDWIVENITRKELILLSNEFDINMTELIEDCVEEELFEAATNIKKWNDGFYNL